MSNLDFVKFFKAAYPDESWPKPFHLLEGLQRVAAGETVKDAAKAVGTLPSILEKLAGSSQPAHDIIGVQPTELGCILINGGQIGRKMIQAP
ncbi:MAG TPA: hypothetical protein VH370_08380 [Humisphaera sp.]|jgi:hypothetical protein|nr:hypothetical protein [Humisphaera sp.]